MAGTEYRKGKIQIYGCFLYEKDAEIVRAAVDRASQKTGVTNNYKMRFSLLEMAKHYLETTNDLNVGE